MIEIILEIKFQFLEYLITKDIKHLHNILLLYLDEINCDVKLLENVDFFIRTDSSRYFNSLRYLAFLYEYNLDEERYITTQEQIAVDIVLIDFDNTAIIHTDLERFEVYKNKFLK